MTRKIVIEERNPTGTVRRQLAAELKARYEHGATVRALAAEAGRSYGFVHRLLSEAGTDFRPTVATRHLRTPRS